MFWKEGESPKPSREGSGWSETSIDDDQSSTQKRIRVNNAYDLTDLKDSVLGSPLETLAKFVTAGAKIVKVVDAALKEEDEDNLRRAITAL